MNATAGRAAALLLALIGSCGNASADGITLFGVTLGAPFQVPECPKKIVADATVYAVATATTCFERLGSPDRLSAATPITNDAVLIRYALDDAPAVMSGGTSIAFIVDGLLEGWTFNTRGVEAQVQVLEVLRQSFGEPGTYARKQAQNVLGETFETFDATWVRPEADVLYRSVTERLDTGLLTVYTARAREVRPRASAAAAPAKAGT
jgi:hypothetical protein